MPLNGMKVSRRYSMVMQLNSVSKIALRRYAKLAARFNARGGIMSWIFEGTTAEISLSLSENGHWSVRGTASQNCHPLSHDFEIIRHVRGLPALWSIHSIEDAEHRYVTMPWDEA
jgi:hypothetical protein